jgi:hypothetical protein
VVRIGRLGERGNQSQKSHTPTCCAKVASGLPFRLKERKTYNLFHCNILDLGYD